MNPLCSECTTETACGKSHIYVVELDSTVVTSSKFMKQNPNYVEGKECFYVGATGHSVRCRFNQHQRFGTDETSFECSCFEQTTTRYFRGRHEKGKTRGNTFVGQHGRYLRGKMFKKENPFDSKQEAEAREATLAQELRAKGFGIWQN